MSDKNSPITNNESSDDSSPEEFEEDSEIGSLMNEEDLPSTTEFEYALLDISHVLKCLYRFSTMLRAPMPINRIQKCKSIDVKHYESWDIQHVANKFPGLPDYLQQRLGRANTKRRQLFIYHERHHRKIAQSIEKVLKPEQDYPADSSQKPTGGRPGTILSATTATTLHVIPGSKNDIPVLGVLPEDCESDTGRSQTSYASSHAGNLGSDSYKLPVPDPPNLQYIGCEAFECPYCYNVVFMRNSKSWR